MLALWPAQDSEHVPTTMSRGRLTNSTMIQTSDARRRLEMQRRENLKEAIAKRERKGVGHAK